MLSAGCVDYSESGDVLSHCAFLAYAGCYYMCLLIREELASTVEFERLKSLKV